MERLDIMMRILSVTFMIYASLILVLSITIGLDNVTILFAFLYFIFVISIQLMAYNGFALIIILLIIFVKRVERDRAIIYANLMCTGGLLLSLMFQYK